MKEKHIIVLKNVLYIALVYVFVYIIGLNTGKIVDVMSGSIIGANEIKSWGLGFGENGTTPTGTDTKESLKMYNSFFVGDEEEKVLYLTFDCGFENGNTEQILDALAIHNVSATFFVVGNYIETAPELIQRMIEEGHTVGNHTYYHPDMTLKSEAEFGAELELLKNYYKEITGEEISSYYRPPQGSYTLENLEWANHMGYQTIFWSLAYVDWYQDDQPTKEEAFDKLLNRVHPGAIILLHNTSSTNAEILDELLTKWEEMGYSFASLEEL
ncbi:MAG: polysaccharide deacetylase family protein [Eubacteriales bacterium]